MTFVLPLVAAALAIAGSDGAPAAKDAPPAPVYPQWNGTLSFGASWTSGNTESDSVTGTFNAVRRGEKDRWTFDAFLNYGSTTDTATDDKTGTSARSRRGRRAIQLQFSRRSAPRPRPARASRPPAGTCASPSRS